MQAAQLDGAEEDPCPPLIGGLRTILDPGSAGLSDALADSEDVAEMDGAAVAGIPDGVSPE